MCFDCRNFIKKNSEILDLGCGSGIVAKNFQDFFQSKIIGVDIQDKRIIPIPFKIIDGKHLPFGDKSFDVVLINYVLHHSENPITLLKEAKRVTRDKIVVYEDLSEDIFSKFLCWFHKITFSWLFQKNKVFDGMFKNTREWKDIFDKLGIKTVFQKVFPHTIYPLKRQMFVLENI